MVVSIHKWKSTPDRCLFVCGAEETQPKNIATSIKDTRFLDFFFSKVRDVNASEIRFLQACGAVTSTGVDYPFVSPCGKELNFIRPAATPIVFHALSHDDTTLTYAGTMTQPLDYSKLAVSKKTGRLYHQLNIESGIRKSRRTASEYGLIRSSVAVALSERIVDGLDDGRMAIATPHGLSPVPWLPEVHEPGLWSFPLRDDS